MGNFFDFKLLRWDFLTLYPEAEMGLTVGHYPIWLFVIEKIMHISTKSNLIFGVEHFCLGEFEMNVSLTSNEESLYIIGLQEKLLTETKLINPANTKSQ